MRAQKIYLLNEANREELSETLRRFPIRSPFIHALENRINARAGSDTGSHLTKDDINDLKDLGVKAKIVISAVPAPPATAPTAAPPATAPAAAPPATGPIRFVTENSVDRHLKDDESAPTPQIPPRYLRGFNSDNLLACALRTLAKTAIILPLGTLAKGYSTYASSLSTNAVPYEKIGFFSTTWNSLADTFNSIGNLLLPVSTEMKSLGTAATITLGLTAVTLGVVLDGLKKRTARRTKVREDAGIKINATPLHYAEDRIAKGFSLIADHWKKVAFGAAGISLITELASKGALGEAFKLTMGFALKAASFTGTIISENGTWLVSALIVYELMRLRYEYGSAATFAKEKARAAAEAQAQQELAARASAT